MSLILPLFLFLPLTSLLLPPSTPPLSAFRRSKAKATHESLQSMAYQVEAQLFTIEA